MSRGWRLVARPSLLSCCFFLLVGGGWTDGKKEGQEEKASIAGVGRYIMRHIHHLCQNRVLRDLNVRRLPTPSNYSPATSRSSVMWQSFVFSIPRRFSLCTPAERGIFRDGW
jgi:hypothetical protein